MKRFIAVFVFGILLVSIANAADLIKTVFGVVTIGEPINLPECTKAKLGYYEYPQKTVCIQPPFKEGMFTRIEFPADASPLISKNSNLIAWVKDGVVLGAEFITPGAGAGDVVFAELIKKYGKATSITNGSAQTLGGGRFTDRTGLWDKGEIKVTYWELYREIDQGKVIVETPFGKQMRESWGARDIKKGPSL